MIRTSEGQVEWYRRQKAAEAMSTAEALRQETEELLAKKAEPVSIPEPKKIEATRMPSVARPIAMPGIDRMRLREALTAEYGFGAANHYVTKGIDVAKVARENPKLFPNVRSFRTVSEAPQGETVNQATPPSAPYDPELYEQKTLEQLKKAQWTIDAIERGSTFVVDPVEDLVKMLRLLEECGVVSVSKVGENDTTFSLNIVVRTAEVEEEKEVDIVDEFEATKAAAATATFDRETAPRTFKRDANGRLIETTTGMTFSEQVQDDIRRQEARDSYQGAVSVTEATLGVIKDGLAKGTRPRNEAGASAGFFKTGELHSDEASAATISKLDALGVKVPGVNVAYEDLDAEAFIASHSS